VLGLGPTEADAEVNRLEHMVSDPVLARLEVLNAFALSSDGWIRRLQVRLRGRERSGPDPYYRVGSASAHAEVPGQGKQD
jgi:hypothetical protein